MKCAVLMTMLGLVTVASVLPCGAHTAPSGWQYPMECCHQMDCGTVTTSEPEVGVDGRITGETILTNSLGLRGVTYPNTSYKASPDGKDHVCIRGGKVVCRFTGQGM